VDLSRARVNVDRPEGMVLYLKGRFLPADTPKRDEQLEFDRKLLASGVVSPDGKGPRLTELRELMRKRQKAQDDGAVKRGAPADHIATPGDESVLLRRS
jgi:hypothetical protein